MRKKTEIPQRKRFLLFTDCSGDEIACNNETFIGKGLFVNNYCYYYLNNCTYCLANHNNNIMSSCVEFLLISLICLFSLILFLEIVAKLLPFRMIEEIKRDLVVRSINTTPFVLYRIITMVNISSKMEPPQASYYFMS